MRELRLQNNLLSGTLPDGVRINQSWPESYGVRGPGGPAGSFASAITPTELAVSRLHTLHLENNRLSGSVPSSMTECTSLVDLHRTFAHNLLSGSTPLELAGHGREQRFHPLSLNGVTHPGSHLPMAFRRPGDLPYQTFEAHDACMWNPNVRFRCDRLGFEVGQGGGMTYVHSGSPKSCADLITVVPYAGTWEDIPLSLEYNHRQICQMSMAFSTAIISAAAITSAVATNHPLHRHRRHLLFLRNRGAARSPRKRARVCRFSSRRGSVRGAHGAGARRRPGRCRCPQSGWHDPSW